MVDKQFEAGYEKENKVLVFLVVLACFFSNISQLPFLVSAGITQKLNTPIWIVLLLYIFLNKKIRISYNMFRVFFALGIVFVLILLSIIITNNSYFNSSVLQSLILSLFIYCLGSFAGKQFTDENLKILSLSYAISATIVALSIYVEYFSVGFDITSRQYAYASKNSISQIIFTSIVILMFIHSDKHGFFNRIKVIVIVFEVTLLMLLRSRATIVGFAICLLYIIFGKEFNCKIKYLLTMIVVVGTLTLLMNENIFEMFVNNIMFAGRDASSLDSLTSGRVSILSEFPALIDGHWLTGIGSLYFECFPLSCILQFGIIAGSIIIGIAYLPIIKCLKIDRKNVYSSIFVIICIGYGINSIFEGLAPIGPGVKCYYMWLMYGILCTRDVKKYA